MGTHQHRLRIVQPRAMTFAVWALVLGDVVWLWAGQGPWQGVVKVLCGPIGATWGAIALTNWHRVNDRVRAVEQLRVRRRGGELATFLGRLFLRRPLWFDRAGGGVFLALGLAVFVSGVAAFI